jgi:transposase
VPVLGRFEDDEPRSIHMMDNPSIHISERVKQLIEEAAGAILLYTAPYSPYLNPIEFVVRSIQSSL